MDSDNEFSTVTNFCAASLPLNFLFCSFFKRCQYRRCLILSSFLLFAAFKKEDSGFDEVGWKQVNFGELVTLLAQFQPYATVLYAVFFYKYYSSRSCWPDVVRTALQLIFLAVNHAVTQCIWCVIYSCEEHGGFSLSSQRRPSGSVSFSGLPNETPPNAPIRFSLYEYTQGSTLVLRPSRNRLQTLFSPAWSENWLWREIPIFHTSNSVFRCWQARSDYCSFEWLVHK